MGPSSLKVFEESRWMLKTGNTENEFHPGVKTNHFPVPAVIRLEWMCYASIRVATRVIMLVPLSGRAFLFLFTNH